MAKPKLQEMRIRRAPNGSHHVVHSFAATPKLAKGALTGGMTMDHPPDQEFNFGPKEGGNLMKHIATALALKQAMPAAGPQTASAPTAPDEEQPVAAD